MTMADMLADYFAAHRFWCAFMRAREAAEAAKCAQK